MIGLSRLRSTEVEVALRRPSDQRPHRLLALALLVLLLVAAGTAWTIASSQDALRHANIERFAGRAEVNARFVGSYLEQVEQRLVALAREGAPSTDEEVAALIRMTVFDELIVRDAQGVVLAEHPPGHVPDALAVTTGHWATASLIGGEPAIGVRHEAGGGLVVEARMGLDDSQFARFIGTAAPSGNVGRFLVDADGELILAQGQVPSALLERALAGSLLPRVSLEADGERWQLVSSELPDDGWVLTLAVKEAELFTGVAGWRGAAPWVVFGLMLLAGMLAALALVRLDSQRQLLAESNVSLAARGRALAAGATIAEASNAAQHVSEAVPALEVQLQEHLGVERLRLLPTIPPSESRDLGAGSAADRAFRGGQIVREAAEDVQVAAVPLVVGGAVVAVLEVRFEEQVGATAIDIDTTLRVLGSTLAALLEREGVLLELERSNAELEQFAYVASHDLQEPLRKVASYCQLLQRRYQGQLDDDADEFIAYAVDGAKRMQQLIQDLLAYSRAGRFELDTVEVDLDRLVERVLEDLRFKIEESDAAVDVPDGLPTVLGDEAMLGQVLQNTLDNALKFHGEDPPRISLRAASDGDRVHLVVADEGIGIPQEHAERVFGLFQRLHGRSEYAGTGLGLAICRRILERHGGNIELRARAPRGTEVHIDLPRPTETTT